MTAGHIIATLHPNTLQNLSHIVYALHECARSEKQTLRWKVGADGIVIYEPVDEGEQG